MNTASYFIFITDETGDGDKKFVNKILTDLIFTVVNRSEKKVKRYSGCTVSDKTIQSLV